MGIILLPYEVAGVVVASPFAKFEFENGVISYGSQSVLFMSVMVIMFENGVISYGSQSLMSSFLTPSGFENGVISYGSQSELAI